LARGPAQTHAFGSLRFRRNFLFRPNMAESILPPVIPVYHRVDSSGQLQFLTRGACRRTPVVPSGSQTSRDGSLRHAAAGEIRGLTGGHTSPLAGGIDVNRMTGNTPKPAKRAPSFSPRRASPGNAGRTNNRWSPGATSGASLTGSRPSENGVAFSAARSPTAGSPWATGGRPSTDGFWNRAGAFSPNTVHLIVVTD